MSRPCNALVVVEEANVEAALKKLKRKLALNGTTAGMRRRKYYTKPSTRKRLRAAAARARLRKAAERAAAREAYLSRTGQRENSRRR